MKMKMNKLSNTNAKCYRNDIEIKSGDDLLKVIRKLIFDINTLPLYPILLG